MIITKEHQEQMVINYQKTHSFDEMVGYVDGLNAMWELVEKLSKEDEEKKKELHQPLVISSLPYSKEEWEELKRIKREHEKFMKELNEGNGI
jgi:hypothetical protein